MSNTSGFSVSKPVALWNKPIKADFKELFKSLGKGVINGVFGQWEEVAKDAVEATAALGLGSAPEKVAWLLIYRSLVEAIVSLVKGNQELLFAKPNEGDLELLCDRNDAIRVISGGLGSGKSSFTKIFAANQAEKGKIPVLFIPLHHFEPSDDLVEAVGKFVRDDGFLRHNPLDKDKADSRLLIIFDGLDELAIQGKIAFSFS
ncbi:hypothetical protein [Nostoc sp. C117]|uniref:hypothetical protein n=1 Tax=Nostoc sp. C117 TaxID=3349875 RepID=UPI00370D8836